MRLRTSMLAGALALASFAGRAQDKSALEYAKANIGRLAASQEKALKIKHISLPEIISIDSDRIENTAYYSPVTGSIVIDSTIELSISGMSDFKSDKNPNLAHERFDGILNHELGHHYANERRRSLGYGNWPIENIRDIPPEYRLPMKMISEGIGVYFDVKSSAGIDKHRLQAYLESLGWPRDISDYTKVKIFMTGYKVVAPVIDQFRDAGIDFLINNLPTQEDLTDMKGYQSWVMRCLKKLNAEDVNANHDRETKDLEKQIVRLLPGIVLKQEDLIGMSNDLNISISFLPYSQQDRDAMGAYLPEEGNLAFYTRALMEGFLELHWPNKPRNQIHLRGSIAHETGHLLLDVLGQENGLDIFDSRKDAAHRLANKLASEGLAESLSIMYSNAPVDCSDLAISRPPTEYEKQKRLFYRHAGCTMMPIVRKYKTDGILYVMRNPPVPDDLRNLPGYQKRVLGVLENRK